MNGVDTLHKPVDGHRARAQEVSWSFTSDGKQGALCVQGKAPCLWPKEGCQLTTKDVNNIAGRLPCMVKVQQGQDAASVCMVGYASAGEADRASVKHLSASGVLAVGNDKGSVQLFGNTALERWTQNKGHAMVPVSALWWHDAKDGACKPTDGHLLVGYTNGTLEWYRTSAPNCMSSVCSSPWRSHSPTAYTAKGSLKGKADDNSAIIFCCFLPRQSKHESLRFMACYASGMVAVWRCRRTYGLSDQPSPALGAILLHRLHLNPLGGAQNYSKTGIQFQASYNITGKPDARGPFVFLHANASLASDPKTSGKQEQGSIGANQSASRRRQHQDDKDFVLVDARRGLVNINRIGLEKALNPRVHGARALGGGGGVPLDPKSDEVGRDSSGMVINASHVSADGRMVATAHENGMVMVWDTQAYEDATGDVRRQMKRDLLEPLTQSLPAAELLVCQDTNPGGQGDTLLAAAIRAEEEDLPLKEFADLYQRAHESERCQINDDMLRPLLQDSNMMRCSLALLTAAASVGAWHLIDWLHAGMEAATHSTAWAPLGGEQWQLQLAACQQLNAYKRVAQAAEHVTLATFARAFQDAAAQDREEGSQVLLSPLQSRARVMDGTLLSSFQDGHEDGQGDTLLMAAARAGPEDCTSNHLMAWLLKGHDQSSGAVIDGCTWVLKLCGGKDACLHATLQRNKVQTGVTLAAFAYAYQHASEEEREQDGNEKGRGYTLLMAAASVAAWRLVDWLVQPLAKVDETDYPVSLKFPRQSIGLYVVDTPDIRAQAQTASQEGAGTFSPGRVAGHLQGLFHNTENDLDNSALHLACNAFRRTSMWKDVPGAVCPSTQDARICTRRLLQAIVADKVTLGSYVALYHAIPQIEATHPRLIDDVLDDSYPWYGTDPPAKEAIHIEKVTQGHKIDELLRRRMTGYDDDWMGVPGTRVMIPLASKSGTHSVLHSLVRSNRERVLHLYGTSIFRGVLRTKWRAFGRTYAVLQLLLYMVMIAMFGVFALRGLPCMACHGADLLVMGTLGSACAVASMFSVRSILSTVHSSWHYGWPSVKDYPRMLLAFAAFSLPLVVITPMALAEDKRGPSWNLICLTAGESVLMFLQAFYYLLPFRKVGNFVSTVYRIVFQILPFVLLVLLCLLGFAMGTTVLYYVPNHHGATFLPTDVTSGGRGRGIDLSLSGQNATWDSSTGCPVLVDDPKPPEYSADQALAQGKHYADFKLALLHEYAMMLGYNDAVRGETGSVARTLMFSLSALVLFVFSLNLLIAILVDLYTTMKNEEKKQFFRGRSIIIDDIESILPTETWTKSESLFYMAVYVVVPVAVQMAVFLMIMAGEDLPDREKHWWKVFAIQGVETIPLSTNDLRWLPAYVMLVNKPHDLDILDKVTALQQTTRKINDQGQEMKATLDSLLETATLRAARISA
ncbi:hypothetical protein WJX72_003600 [[Myrmecia] bisecta]|uniref:Ion transport domain-containing protein n=1 Tax=[Myrmecia] bisecta TaxID=41462 RepID=A0AAW1Q4A1_9CHLO